MSEFKPSILDRPEFVEPILIKSGDKKVRLGQLQQAPIADCRVVAENLYQDFKLAYDIAPELLEALQDLIHYVGKIPSNGKLTDDLWDAIHIQYKASKQAISKAL